QFETARLDDGNLVPDEDVLEQAGRGQDDVPGSMKMRTRHYRRQLPEFLFRDNWQASLRGMGTCGYMGTIPPDRIARVALLDRTLAPTVVWGARDAFISLSNYRFCASKYRNLTRRLFGLPLEVDPLDGDWDEALADDPALPETIREIVRQRANYNRILADEFAAAVEVRDL